MQRIAILAGLSVALAAAPVLSQAQQLASTSKQSHLRAGPDRTYPIVSILPAGAQVVVQGCMQDYRWCDVSFGPQRGWVFAGNLQYPYQSSYAPLPAVAAVVGIGVMAFVLNDYWGDHYRDRTWYRDRDRWVRPYSPVRPHIGPRPPPQAYPQRPPQHAGRPVPPQSHAVPVQPRPQPAAPQRPRPQRNDVRTNSGWDSRHPDAPRVDKP